jgi:hypothetical protein
MVKMFGTRLDRMMPEREYLELVRQQKRKKRLHQKWLRDNPFEEWAARQEPRKHTWTGDPKPYTEHEWKWASPYHNYHRIISDYEWERLDQSNLYYDECMEEINARVQRYNRVALIIQGLFDRSAILHPHPPVQTWTPEGFEAAIELIYDSDRALYAGELPDIQAYRERCNESMDADSVVYGQEDYWELREGEKEDKKRSYREHDWHTVKRYRPFGNEGPGTLAKMAKWMPRARKAVFRWHRERQSWDPYAPDGPVVATITVPAAELFNVSAYQPGDFRQFFEDPRTREKYLEWAPMLLTAEDFHAGKAEVQEPVKKG